MIEKIKAFTLFVGLVILHLCLHLHVQHLNRKEEDLMNWRLKPIKIENPHKNLHENAIDAFKEDARKMVGSFKIKLFFFFLTTKKDEEEKNRPIFIAY